MATLALLSLVAAAPQLNFPFNSQLPPVGHWGQAYTYTISGDIYKSSAGAITYTASNLPSWLTLNGLTLTGTPTGGSGDTTVSFQLDATDATGTSTDTCVIQLTDKQAPSYTEEDLFKALEASGQVASSNSFVLVPNKPFEIDFPGNFFTVPDSQNVIGHYAMTSDHSPLPIWLDFDGAAGKFTGTAPAVNSEIAEAQQFPILYMISTFPGFESAAAPFNLLLGANVLSMNISSMEFEATPNHFFTYNIPLGEIKLNGEPITPANISHAQASIPGDAQSWLSWNSENFTLSGTPPESAANSNVTVNIELADTYSDAVSWNIGLTITPENNETVFTTSNLPAANATRGQWFSYDLSNYILNKDVQLSLNPGVSWLTMHNDNWTINGQVPSNFGSVMVNITATESDSSNSKNKRAAGSDGIETDNGMTAHIQLTGVGPILSSSSRISSTVSSSRVSSSTLASSSRIASSSRVSSSRISSSAVRTVSSASKRSGSSSGVSSSTSSSSASVLPLPKVQNKQSNNNAVAIGCGVGISVGVVLIAAILVLLFCCRRRRRQREAAGKGPSNGKSPVGPNDSYLDVNEDSNISNPRPSSKGIAMAPVFRTTSSDQDSFEDALEYPGELGDDGTMISTPEKEAKLRGLDDNDDANWNSPQRASTLNFLAMNGHDNSSQTTLPVPADDEQNNNDGNAMTSTLPPNTGTGPHEIPQSREEDDVVADIPRESWRHTNTGERRWQEHRMSHSSLASIVPTEPPTVQLASDEFASSSVHNNNHNDSNNHNNNNASDFPALPANAMQREYSSGVIHRVGSHSSSHYSESLRHSRTVSQQISGHYRTDSSTDSRNSNEMSDDSSGANFRPYRDENGDLHWREENPTGNARLRSTLLDRKPSAAKTPKGDTGEFVFV